MMSGIWQRINLKFKKEFHGIVPKILKPSAEPLGSYKKVKPHSVAQFLFSILTLFS